MEKVVTTSRGLTTAEVSERCGIAISTLDHWRINGLGPPARRVDGRISYDEVSFERWLETYRAQATKGRLRPGPRRR